MSLPPLPHFIETFMDNGYGTYISKNGRFGSILTPAEEFKMEIPLKWLFFSWICLAPAVLAQTNAGSISGTVLDQRQAAMAGVKITAPHFATNGFPTTTSTNT